VRRTEKKKFQVSDFKFLVRKLKPETWNLKLNAATSSIFLAALFSLAGCLSSFTTPQPDRSRFYALTAQADGGGSGGDLGDMTLGVGPVRLPGYLDREELVTRVAQNRFDVSQNDRWIEPLEENVSQVIAQNLYALLKSERIVRYPWPASRRITHQLEIEILRFEPTSSNEAQLAARWLVVDASTKQPLVNKTTVVKRPIQGGTKEAAVDALSGTLGDLSRDMAETIQKIVQQKANTSR
jgi:uncharacterized lipoprotein YmbA